MKLKNHHLVALVFYTLISLSTAFATEKNTHTMAQTKETELKINNEQADTISMLEALIQLESDIKERTAEVKEKLSRSSSEIEKENLQNRLLTLDRQFIEARDDFERIATNIDIALFIEKKQKRSAGRMSFLSWFNLRSRNLKDSRSGPETKQN